MEQKLWSERAWCYKVTQTETRTMIYYKCLDTSKKIKLTGPKNLVASDYENTTGPLVVNETNTVK